MRERRLAFRMTSKEKLLINFLWRGSVKFFIKDSRFGILGFCLLLHIIIIMPTVQVSNVELAISQSITSR
jgi:hypothetical protein